MARKRLTEPWIVAAWLLALLLLGGGGRAGAEQLGLTTSVEDPGGEALTALHAALGRAAQGKGRARLLFYGDSHIARDHYTGELRRRLQTRFGDAGAGFVPLALPFDHYRHQLVTVSPPGDWRRLRPVGARGPVDAYGVLGVALEASSEAWAQVSPRGGKGLGQRATHIDLHYLRQPGGGTVVVRVDGARKGRLKTAEERRQVAFERIKVRDGSHRLEVEAAGDGPVRVFGASLERYRPGVIVDTLGIPGARARDQLPWDVAAQRAQLRRLGPDLIVLAYGTNESMSERYLAAHYERELRVIVERMQEALPRSSCLLIGPSDLPLRQPDGSYAPRPRQAEIVAIQRRVAFERGCGFFDLLAFMGGPGSMLRWVAQVPPMAREDHTHLTRLGQERLAEVLEAALLEGLEPE